MDEMYKWWSWDLRSNWRMKVLPILQFSLSIQTTIKTLRPRQNGRHFADDTFKCIFLNKNIWISMKISLKFVPTGPINNIPALVQIMAWRRPGDKPLSEPMMFSLPTNICVTRPHELISRSDVVVLDMILSKNSQYKLTWVVYLA